MSERPTGHDGPCCGSCLDEVEAFHEGLIDHNHDMHPKCCCRDERDDDEAQRQYDAWIASDEPYPHCNNEDLEIFVPESEEPDDR